MNLLFLHGPPAAGKYTVAKEVATLTGWELFHNHLVVDQVLKHHAFGTANFVAERDRRWREYFGHYPGTGRPDVIFTFNPENTVPQAFIDWLFTELPSRGVAVHSIALSASEAVLESRLASPQRRQFKKLADPALYRQLRDAGTFHTPVIPRTDLHIDTGQVEPIEAARLIVQRFVERAR